VAVGPGFGRSQFGPPRLAANLDLPAARWTHGGVARNLGPVSTELQPIISGEQGYGRQRTRLTGPRLATGRP